MRQQGCCGKAGQPNAYFDIEQYDETAPLIARFGIDPGSIPAVVTAVGQVLLRPTLRQLVDAAGISPDSLDGREFDVVVAGAGPGGLAAAAYAASEGLRVAVLDAKAPGGQAGTSSKIENYFGFPTGISGQALAGRGLSQARKFGAEVLVPFTITDVACGDGAFPYNVGLDSCERVRARAIVIATGARYRKPALAELGAAWITTPRSWKRPSAPTRTWWWSAAAIRPGRRRCSCRVMRATSTWSCAGRA